MRARRIDRICWQHLVSETIFQIGLSRGGIGNVPFCNSNKLVFAHIYNCSAVQTFLASLLPFLFARELVLMKKPKYFLLATEL
jgi:hypothetical protein